MRVSCERGKCVVAGIRATATDVNNGGNDATIMPMLSEDNHERRQRWPTRVLCYMSWFIYISVTLYRRRKNVAKVI